MLGDAVHATLLLARIVGEEMRQRLSKTVIVENKPGASGNIGDPGGGARQSRRPNPSGHRQYIRDECKSL
jgi:hypothetical protein